MDLRFIILSHSQEWPVANTRPDTWAENGNGFVPVARMPWWRQRLEVYEGTAPPPSLTTTTRHQTHSMDASSGVPGPAARLS